MEIEIIKCLDDNYSYIIFEKKTNTVSIVDPSEFSQCDKAIQKYKRLDYISCRVQRVSFNMYGVLYFVNLINFMSLHPPEVCTVYTCLLYKYIASFMTGSIMSLTYL